MRCPICERANRERHSAAAVNLMVDDEPCLHCLAGVASCCEGAPSEPSVDDEWDGQYG